jgi:hypothetical protein
MRPELEFAETLRRKPEGALAPYLALLTRLLEEAVGLDYGFFNQSKIQPADLPLLVADIQRLAQQAILNALDFRPGEVVRWVEQLNQLQKPKFIDFVEWEKLARAAPAAKASVSMSPIPEALKVAVEALRAVQPDNVGAPTPADFIEQELERDPKQFSSELVALYRLANGLRAEFDTYRFEIPAIDPKRESSWSKLSLWNKYKSGNPWIYEYRFEPDGSIVQTEWSRLDDPDIQKVEPPQFVAGSLASMLMLALSQERLSGKPPKWTPGPLLPVAGTPVEAPKPAKKSRTGKVKASASDLRNAIKTLIKSKVAQRPMNFAYSAHPPKEDEIRALQGRLGVTFPADYAQFLSMYGAARFEATEEVWPRPELGWSGPAWECEYAVTIFGTGSDVPDSDPIERIAEEFSPTNPSDETLVPFCSVELTGDHYCFDKDGNIVFVRRDGAIEQIQFGFVEVLEQQLDQLLERIDEKVKTRP